MRPIDLAANETVTFVSAHLLARPLRILDVGCGSGLVARRLQDRGHKVIAIDEDAEMIAQARALGLDARVAAWPSLHEAPFDAVLSARSLHHIHPLSAAVEQAARLLAPSGLGIVDEFAWVEVVPATAEWFYGVTRLLEACQVLTANDDSFAADLLRSEGEFAFWHQSHDDELHAVTAMWSALQSHVLSICETSVPYLYRYLCPVLPENDSGHAIVAEVLAMEQRLAQLGTITLIGRRFVGQKR